MHALVGLVFGCAAANNEEQMRSASLRRVSLEAQPVQQSTVLAMMQLLLTAVTALFAMRRPPNAIALRADPCGTPALAVDGSQYDTPISKWSASGMLVGLKRVWTEVGTAGMALSIADGTWQLLANSVERTTHLHHALGVSKGTSLALICGISVAQTLGGASLLTPAVYERVGAVAPSAIITGALWAETWIFGDTTDVVTFVRSAALTLTLGMLALFRVDRQARNARLQIPTNDHLLAIESKVKKVCTDARVGIVFPPLSLLLVALCVSHCAFWRAHGLEYEWKRARFHAIVSTAALMLVSAGQDGRAHNLIEERLERLHGYLMRRKEHVLGQPTVFRPLGRKKAL